MLLAVVQISESPLIPRALTTGSWGETLSGANEGLQGRLELV